MKELIEIQNNNARLRIAAKWLKECKYTDFNKFYKRWIEKNPTIENGVIEDIKEALKHSTDKNKKMMLFEEKTNKKINQELKKLINYISKQKNVYYQSIENSDKCMISDSFIVIECLKSDIEASKNSTFRNILEELYQEEKRSENGYLKPKLTVYHKASDRYTVSDSNALEKAYDGLLLQFEKHSDNTIKTDFKELISINRLDESKKNQSYTSKENVTMKRSFIDAFKNKEFKYNENAKAVYKNNSDYRLYAMTMKA